MRATLIDDGGEGDVVVYLPGIGGTGALMTPCGVRLRERFRVVRLGWVGGGEDSYAALTRSVDQLLTELGVGPAVFLAESFGGAVAYLLALDHPGRVSGLAIVNSFDYYPWRIRLSLNLAIVSILSPRLYQWVRRHLGLRKLFGRRLDPVEAARLNSKAPRLDDAYRRRIAMIRSLDLRERLGEVSVPVALYASRRDRIVPSLPCARAMKTRLPDATMEVVEHSGHLVLPLPDLPWPLWMGSLVERAKESAVR